MDAIGLLRGVWQRARDAKRQDLETTLKQRHDDYYFIIEQLKSKDDAIDERERGRLCDLFKRVKDLKRKYTAAPEDSSAENRIKPSRRAAYHVQVNTELKEIDAEVMRQLAIMNLKGAVSSSEMKEILGRLGEVLEDVGQKMENLESLVNERCCPSLPDQSCRLCG